MAVQADVDRVFKALSDPTRRQILQHIDGRALAVVAIAGYFPEISRPAISKHLRILREAGLVDEEQQGRKRLYCLRQASLEAVRKWLRGVGAADLRRRTGGGRKTRSPKAEASTGIAGRVGGDDWRAW